MLMMDPATLRSALEQLEQATEDHIEWHANLLRSLVCGLPCDMGDLAATAHLQCRFGRWYHEQAPAELRRHQEFAAIGAQHERLHRVATRLLRDAGADEPIDRDDFEELVSGSARLRLELDSLRSELDSALRNRDPLTGALSRIEMLPDLHKRRALAQRGVQQCCIAFMDIDQLKRINDTHGHPVGDSVLAGTIRYLSDHLRPDDKVYRYGGDEFLIALSGADLATGQKVITRVRKGLAKGLAVLGPGGVAVHVTASFGLALLDPEVGVTESVDRADQALLLAKTAGHNRAISWDPSITTGKELKRLEVDEGQA